MFSFSYYPFDTQQCDIKFEIVNSLQNSLNLTYLGYVKKTLSNHFPSEYYLSESTTSYENYLLIFTFMMTRHPSYPIFSIYFPTALMHIIAYGTLWIPVINFQDRGTMSLTTLLVLIAFYSDVLSQLPVTAYLKFLDIWFIFSISYLSTIIFIHLMTSDNADNDTKVHPFNNKKQANRCSLTNPYLLKISRLCLGSGYLIFQFGYWGYLLLVIMNEDGR